MCPPPLDSMLAPFDLAGPDGIDGNDDEDDDGGDLSAFVLYLNVTLVAVLDALEVWEAAADGAVDADTNEEDEADGTETDEADEDADRDVETDAVKSDADAEAEIGADNEEPLTVSLPRRK